MENPVYYVIAAIAVFLFIAFAATFFVKRMEGPNKKARRERNVASSAA